MNKEEHGKLEIKKLTVSEGQSEETLSFHASIYWLGEKVGAASNDGTGGCSCWGTGGGGSGGAPCEAMLCPPGECNTGPPDCNCVPCGAGNIDY